MLCRKAFFLSRISWTIFSWPILSNIKTQKSLEYCKIHFPVLFCLRQKDGEISNFGPKPWTKPLSKNPNSSTLLTCCFYSLRRRFFLSRVLQNKFSWSVFPYTKRWKFFEQNHGLNNFFGKPQFFITYLTSCFHSLDTFFFFVEHRRTLFLGLFCLK